MAGPTGDCSSCACAGRAGLPPSAEQGLQGKVTGAAEPVTAGEGEGWPVRHLVAEVLSVINCWAGGAGAQVVGDWAVASLTGAGLTVVAVFPQLVCEEEEHEGESEHTEQHTHVSIQRAAVADWQRGQRPAGTGGARAGTE